MAQWASELRIGNLIEVAGLVVRATPDDIKKISLMPESSEKYKRVPLTIKWLLENRFEVDPSSSDTVLLRFSEGEIAINRP